MVSVLPATIELSPQATELSLLACVFLPKAVACLAVASVSPPQAVALL